VQFLAKETALNKFESMIEETRGLSEGKYSVELPIAKLEPILTAADEYYWGDGAMMPHDALMPHYALIWSLLSSC